MSKYIREEIYMAWQFKYDNTDEKHPLPSLSSENYLTIPSWILGAVSDGIIKYENISTLTCNGEKVNIGDYIVMRKDEYKIYTKDSFERLFKKVEKNNNRRNI